ncbi:MAG: hypothetical protein EOO79_05310 [Oxalobacteraceae bacterium]|nr:MAG: hypothetical protein EOO79_05310 [Oxalobacteraceae bacterium]
MADLTDWDSLKQRCVEHDCKLALRAETTDDVYLSLAAWTSAFPPVLTFDLRAPLGDNAPQHIITQLVNQALEEWWA